jgi:hypothetical protein
LFAHDLHIALAATTVAILLVAAAEALGRIVRGGPPRRSSAAMSAIVVVVIGMTAAGGLAMLALGQRPREPLHLIYAVLAAVLVPLGDSLSVNATPRRRALARLIATLVTLGVVARLFATG